MIGPPLKLGCIADDLTGGTDLANEFARHGIKVIQVVGVPTAELDEIAGHDDDFEVVVVALKTRTATAEQAVAQTLSALDWLTRTGCQRFYVKYCSTFDSSAAGNIGPVLEAVMTTLDVPFTVACPAFPAAGRTVYRGHLFVDDQLLSESPMRNHPLTPMRDSSVVRLLQAQTQVPISLIDETTVARGTRELARVFETHADGEPSIAVIDAIDDDNLIAIGQAARDLTLVSGASGLAGGMSRWFGPRTETNSSQWVQPETGPRAVLAGSRSPATADQIRSMARHRPTFVLDPAEIQSERSANGALVDTVVDWARLRFADQPVLVHPELSDDPEPAAVSAQIAASLETTLADIAVGLVAAGVRQLIVAGGETSGAVVTALGPTALSIGPQISPGVPWTTCLGDMPRIALVCKSGNFGDHDFFERAWTLLP
jgi:3-dehydrotetronate 4-kinase